MDYSLVLLSCVAGETVMNYNDGGGGGEYDTSAVVFRLCPSKSCRASSYGEGNGCSSGYGDYVIGLNTFMEFYMRYVEEQQQQQEQQNNNNNNNRNGYYYNGQYNGQNNGQNNNAQQYNSWITYNQFGVEFDASEYMECAEYDNEVQEQQEDGNGNYQNNYYSKYDYNYNYQNGDGEIQYFIGPGCTADGTTIGLKLYYDDECSYPAFKVNFAKLSYGMWPTGLPYANGGLVSSQCIDCFSQNDNYEWELSEMCTDLYEESSSRCERRMKLNNNYYNNGQQQQQQRVRLHRIADGTQQESIRGFFG